MGMVTPAEARQVCSDFARSMNLNLDIGFMVRDSWKDIYGAEGTAGGGFHSAEDKAGQSFITIAAGNHASIDAVKRTVQHEVAGHYLINTYSPDVKSDILTAIINSKNNESMKPAWNHVESKYTELSISMQAEEVWAYIAEKSNLDLAATVDIARLKLNPSKFEYSDFETIVQSRVDKLRNGALSQQIFPANDVHNIVDDRYNSKLIADEWKARQEPDAVVSPSKPSLTLV